MNCSPLDVTAPPSSGQTANRVAKSNDEMTSCVAETSNTLFQRTSLVESELSKSLTVQNVLKELPRTGPSPLEAVV